MKCNHGAGSIRRKAGEACGEDLPMALPSIFLILRRYIGVPDLPLDPYRHPLALPPFRIALSPALPSRSQSPLAPLIRLFLMTQLLTGQLQKHRFQVSSTVIFGNHALLQNFLWEPGATPGSPRMTFMALPAAVQGSMRGEQVALNRQTTAHSTSWSGAYFPEQTSCPTLQHS